MKPRILTRLENLQSKHCPKGTISLGHLQMAFFPVELLFSLVLAGAGLAVVVPDECAPVRCEESGPEIRFPFWLKDRQPESCGYPGFELSCNRNNDTRFEFQFPVRALTKNNLNNNIVLPVSVQVSVLEIDYKSQMIQIAALNSSCLPDQLPVDQVNSSFTFENSYSYYPNNFTLFNCSSKYTKRNLNHGYLYSCLSSRGYDVIAFSSLSRVSDIPLESCMKMYDIFDVTAEVLFNQQEYYGLNQVNLHWSKPSCGACETQGKYCRLEKNSTTRPEETYCFGKPEEHPPKKRRKGISRRSLVTGLALSFSLFLLAVVLLGGFIFLKRKKEDGKKVETLLENYKAHNPTRFSYADIKKMTSHFREKLGHGSYGTTYKGKLTNGIAVAVKVLNSSGGKIEEFVGQLARMGGIQHENVARFVGYSADRKNKRALVYEFLPNGSLEKFIFPVKQSKNKPVDWEELQQIAIDIAQGIDYLHRQVVLHLDIKLGNVLLDQNRNPRLTDYGIPKLCLKEQILQATMEYTAPEVSSSFGNATPKSDVYSFGILLFEMVRRRGLHSNAAEPSCKVYLPESMYNEMDQREEIAFQVYGDQEEHSYKVKRKLIVVGLWCTQWHPLNRPSMKSVIQMLRGKEMPVVPLNPFAPQQKPQTT